jgi:hypothetical protein
MRSAGAVRRRCDCRRPLSWPCPPTIRECGLRLSSTPSPAERPSAGVTR